MGDEGEQDNSIRFGILAFIDVLGFGHFLKNNTPQNENDTGAISRLNEMIRCYNNHFSHHKEFAKDHVKFVSDYEGGEYLVISYSDCISFFISDYPTKNDSLQGKQLGTLILQLAFTQYEFASNYDDYQLMNAALNIEHQDKFLLKGGITMGYGYINENLVTGPAQLESYKFGDKNNIYPRILIQTKILEKLQYDWNSNPFIVKDNNNCFFVNFLHISEAFGNEGLDKIHDFIDYNLRFIQHPQKVQIYYQWTAKYYNSFCDHWSKPNLRIDRSLITDADIRNLNFIF